jgi:proteasome-associated ATPase
MPRPARNELSLDPLLASDALSLDQRLQYAASLRTGGPDASDHLDRFLLTHLDRARRGLAQASEKQEELATLIAKLTGPPLHAAMFVRAIATPQGERAIVLHGSSQRVVGVEGGVVLGELQTGDEVFLANNLNLILAKSPRGFRSGGETAFFDRRLANGHLALKWHDEELIVEAAPSLASAELTAGDLVRFDRAIWMALEKVERARGHRTMLEQVPDIGPERIGGLDTQVETMFSALTLALADPTRSALYGLDGRQSILMIGPPGCGKTLMAKAAASELMRMSGTQVRFAVVKPASFESPYVGETQANIRHFFQSLREAATTGYAIAFFDEIESSGRTRGSAVGHHSDKFLAAFLAELDGFTDRKNIAIISATNRKDLIDAALLERISDIEIPVARPDARGARAIFRIHLPATLPFSPNGSEAQATREELVETAVSRFYSPNADSEICVIRFRDGKERTIMARELVSGRIFEQVCRRARRTACERDLRGGEPGVRRADLDAAVSEAIDRMRTTLSAENAHSYLPDLKQDLGIVSVQPVVRKVKQPGRYLNS